MWDGKDGKELYWGQELAGRTATGGLGGKRWVRALELTQSMEKALHRSWWGESLDKGWQESWVLSQFDLKLMTCKAAWNLWFFRTWTWEPDCPSFCPSPATLLAVWPWPNYLTSLCLISSPIKWGYSKYLLNRGRRPVVRTTWANAGRYLEQCLAYSIVCICQHHHHHHYFPRTLERGGEEKHCGLVLPS